MSALPPKADIARTYLCRFDFDDDAINKATSDKAKDALFLYSAARWEGFESCLSLHPQWDQAIGTALISAKPLYP